MKAENLKEPPKQIKIRLLGRAAPISATPTEYGTALSNVHIFCINRKIVCALRAKDGEFVEIPAP